MESSTSQHNFEVLCISKNVHFMHFWPTLVVMTDNNLKRKLNAFVRDRYNKDGGVQDVLNSAAIMYGRSSIHHATTCLDNTLIST